MNAKKCYFFPRGFVLSSRSSKKPYFANTSTHFTEAISQPRQPCSNINRRWGRKGITEAVADNGRGGWYLRVLETGTLQAGDEIEVVSRPFPELSIVLACDAFYRRCHDPAVLAAFIACPPLTESFRVGLQKRLAHIS